MRRRHIFGLGPVSHGHVQDRAAIQNNGHRRATLRRNDSTNDWVRLQAPYRFREGSEKVGIFAAARRLRAALSTARRMIRLLRLERFSGTIKKPQRALFSSLMGSGVFGHGAASNRGVGGASGPALKTDPAEQPPIASTSTENKTTEKRLRSARFSQEASVLPLSGHALRDLLEHFSEDF
jgi:hypothetical protein